MINKNNTKLWITNINNPALFLILLEYLKTELVIINANPNIIVLLTIAYKLNLIIAYFNSSLNSGGGLT